VRRRNALLALLLVLGATLSALSAHATPICYRIRLKTMGTVLVDKTVGLACTANGSQIIFER
jgi:hypothetical protein